jgi:hypothetical protein
MPCAMRWIPGSYIFGKGQQMRAGEPTALSLLKEHYQHRDRAARGWKEKGGKVVAYLCDNVPEELISAAGFFRTA